MGKFEDRYIGGKNVGVLFMDSNLSQDERKRSADEIHKLLKIDVLVITDEGKAFAFPYKE